MNKNELISSIASETGLTKTDSAKAVDAFVNSISSALKSGDEVRCRNPRNGKPINIPARNQAKFKPGKALQDSVN